MKNEVTVRGVCSPLFGCKPIRVRRPLPLPGSLLGANMHHTVRTDERRA